MATEAELREAIDDLWGCIGWDETLKLQSKTLLTAREVHDSIWHNGDHAEPLVVDGKALTSGETGHFNVDGDFVFTAGPRASVNS